MDANTGVRSPDERLITANTVEQEIFAEVMAEIAESGQLPRQVRAYVERRSSGGVANRDAD